MAKKIHFVVTYLIEDDEFEMNYEVQDEKFAGNPIYDDDLGWEPVGEQLDDEDSDYCQAADALWFAVRDLKAVSQ